MAGRIIDFAMSCFIFGWHIIRQNNEVHCIDRISDNEFKALRNGNMAQLLKLLNHFYTHLYKILMMVYHI